MRALARRAAGAIRDRHERGTKRHELLHRRLKRGGGVITPRRPELEGDEPAAADAFGDRGYRASLTAWLLHRRGASGKAMATPPATRRGRRAEPSQSARAHPRAVE